MLQSTGQATDAITKEELKLFCSNPPFPQLVSCRSLTKEYGLNITNKDEIISSLDISVNGTVLNRTGC